MASCPHIPGGRLGLGRNNQSRFSWVGINHETHQTHEQNLLVSLEAAVWDGQKAVLKQPQSRRFAINEHPRTARSVWTACGLPPLS